MGFFAALLPFAINAVASLLGSDEEDQGQRDAIDTQWRMYQQNRADYAPWREEGTTAIRELGRRVAAGPGEYTQSPDYRFLMEQGTEALNRNAAAAHTLDSGAHEKALLSFGQGLASTDYDKYLARWNQYQLAPLQSLAGLGLTATGQTAQLGANVASNIAQNQIDRGAARASSYNQLANIGNTFLGDLDFLKGIGGGGGGLNSYNIPTPNFGGSSGLGGYKW